MKKTLAIILIAIMSVSSGFAGKYSSTPSSSGSSKSWGTTTPSKLSTGYSNTTGSSGYGKSGTTKSSSDAGTALQSKQASTPVKSKSEYVSDFKAKNAQTYTNKFTAEPASRPSYIPQTHVVGGNTYNINYNSGYGGYGYYNALGAFIMFDALEHAANNNYHREMSYSQPVYVSDSHWTFGEFLLFLLEFCIVTVLIIGIIWGIIALVNSSSN